MSKPILSHGAGGYNRGCRCEVCREGSRKSNQGPVRSHGVSGYRRGCRCEVCREVKRRGRQGPVRSHGASGYARGCRCEVCREGNRKGHQGPVRSHGASGYRRGCRCEVCREVNRIEGRIHRARTEPRAAALRAQATGARQPWTPSEDALLRRDDLSRVEMAAILGRTLRSVTKRINRQRENAS